MVVGPGFKFPLALLHFSVPEKLQLEEELDTLLGEEHLEKMFNLLLVLIPAIACIARDPTEGKKERVHSFEVKYNVSSPCTSLTTPRLAHSEKQYLSSIQTVDIT